MAKGRYKNPNYMDEYREKNKEEIALQIKEHRKIPEVKMAISISHKKYREENNWWLQPKLNENAREDRSNNPEKYKNYHLKKDYGITMEQYNELLLKQNNACAICGNLETKIYKKTGVIMKLSVDHNHTNGKIRGLLCNNCNMALGILKESKKTLIKMIKYLIKCYF